MQAWRSTLHTMGPTTVGGAMGLVDPMGTMALEAPTGLTVLEGPTGSVGTTCALTPALASPRSCTSTCGTTMHLRPQHEGQMLSAAWSSRGDDCRPVPGDLNQLAGCMQLDDE